MEFFDDYPRFFTTSKASPFQPRLNGRYRAIIEPHIPRLSRARVLDIASHDGRWSLAALKAGAAHVTGIEARQHLVDLANSNLAHYGIDRSRYTFTCGDVFTLLRSAGKFDVVLCLGFYYHTLRQVELFDLMDRTGADFIVIDTEVTPPGDEIKPARGEDKRLVHRNPYLLQLLPDPVVEEQMAMEDSITRHGVTLVARPSRAAVELIASHFGFRTEGYAWARHFERHPEAASVMRDYQEGWRATFALYRTKPGPA